MRQAWTPAELSVLTGEPIDRLAALADAGLLPRQADGRYSADAWHRIRLIQFARDRGIDEQRLAAAVATQGDLLGIFEGLSSAEPTAHTRERAATELGLAPDLLTELADIVCWDATAIATNEDIEVLRPAGPYPEGPVRAGASDRRSLGRPRPACLRPRPGLARTTAPESSPTHQTGTRPITPNHPHRDPLSPPRPRAGLAERR